MTRKRILEILPIITAYANGEDIQYRLPGSTEDWKTWNEDKTVSPFNHDHWEFRIKPKPREWYFIPNSVHFATKEEAEKFYRQEYHHEIIKAVEAL